MADLTLQVTLLSSAILWRTLKNTVGTVCNVLLVGQVLARQ